MGRKLDACRPANCSSDAAAGATMMLREGRWVGPVMLIMATGCFGSSLDDTEAQASDGPVGSDALYDTQHAADGLPDVQMSVAVPRPEGRDQIAYLAEDLRIGSVQGREESAFGRIGAITIGLDGFMWVLDEQVPVIRVFDADGRWVRNVGRRGQGPGEYAVILGMKTLPTGDVAVWDAGNARITVYQPDGQFRTSFAVHGGAFVADALQVDTAGFLYVRVRDTSRPATASNVPTVLIRLNATGETLANIPLPDGDPEGPDVTVYSADGVLQPFTRRTMTAWSPHGHLVTGRNNSYVFTIHSQEGATQVEREYEPVQVDRRERADWLRFLQARSRSDAAVSSLPGTKPAYRDIVVDDNGRIWIERYAAASRIPAAQSGRAASTQLPEWREPRRFDLFAPTGVYLWTLEVPERTRLLVRRDLYAWGVQQDEVGVSYVVRFRLIVPSHDTN